jgi:hypothetical protein
MATGIELIIKRPSADVAWYDDYLDAQTDASFDAIKASRQRLNDAYAATTAIRINEFADPSDNLTYRMQFIVDGLPTGDIEHAYIYLRKKQKELFDSINDAPFVESSDASFDGVARTYPACLYVEKRRQWFNLKELRMDSYNFVEVNF